MSKVLFMNCSPNKDGNTFRIGKNLLDGVEHDILQSELSNIKQEYSESGNLQYNRIVKMKKRDRATSLLYGLSVISEWELENKQTIYRSKNSDLDLIEQYTFL